MASSLVHAAMTFGASLAHAAVILVASLAHAGLNTLIKALIMAAQGAPTLATSVSSSGTADTKACKISQLHLASN